MELTTSQEQIVLNSLKLTCKQCLQLNQGICRGKECDMFSLKETLDDKINGEAKRRVELLNKLSTKLNTQRTHLNKVRKEKEELLEKRKDLQTQINKLSTSVYKAEKNYLTTQKQIEAIKNGKPINRVVTEQKSHKNYLTTKESVYKKLTELKQQYKTATSTDERSYLSKKIWYYNERLKKFTK